MSTLDPVALEATLQLCRAAEPQPFYPAQHAREMATDRGHLDQHLDALRMAGLVVMTPWESGRGQGYVLTEAGRQALGQPRRLAHLGAVQPLRVEEIDDRDVHRADGPVSDWERGELLLRALQTPSDPRLTRALILVNVLVFLAGCALALANQMPLNRVLLGGNSRILDQTGGATGMALLRDEWWRLLTTCFVHAGALHIGLNMYALWGLGRLCEQVWGRLRFLLVYLIAGWGGSCAALAHTPAGAVGASGAILGLMGGLLAWALLNRRYLPPQLVGALVQQALMVAILTAIIGSSIPNVSNSGHVGGALFGFLAATLLNWHRFGSAAVRAAAITGLIALPVVALAYLHRMMAEAPQWAKYKGQLEELAKPETFRQIVQEVHLRWTMDYVKVAVPLLQERVALRADERQRLAEQLRHLKTEIAKGLQVVELLGRQSEPATEAARLAARDYLRAAQEYWKRLETKLSVGRDAWTDADEQALVEQKRRAEDARRVGGFFE